MIFSIFIICFSLFWMIKYFRLLDLLLFKPNVISVMYMCHILMQLIPSFVLLKNDVSIATINYNYACIITTILIPLGGATVDTIFRSNAKYWILFLEKPISDIAIIKKKIWIFHFCLYAYCIIILCLMIYFTRDAPPLILLIDNIGKIDNNVFILARKSAMHMGRIWGMAQVFFMPLLFSMSLLMLYFCTHFLQKLYFLMALLVPTLYNAWFGAKAPIAQLFVVAILALMLILHMKPENLPDNSNLRMKTRNAKLKIVYTIVCFLFLAIIYPLIIFLMLPTSSEGIEYLFKHIFLRIFLKPAINSCAAFEVFPKLVEFTYFYDIKMFCKLFDLSYIDMSSLIAEYRGMSKLTNSPPTAIGNFYAQGGWVVIFAGVIVAASIFRYAESLILRSKNRSFVEISLYALLLYAAFRFSWANFHTILATESIAPLFFSYFLWKSLRRIDKKAPILRYLKS